MSRSVLRLTLVAALITGCREPTNTGAQLTAALDRWERRGAGSYSVTVARYCECLPEWTGPVVVTVDAGIVSRHYERTGEPVPEQHAGYFPTIEGLFAIIEEARRDRRQLVVRYDRTYGYPRRIDIDPELQPVDGGVTYVASELVIR